MCVFSLQYEMLKEDYENEQDAAIEIKQMLDNVESEKERILAELYDVKSILSAEMNANSQNT